MKFIYSFRVLSQSHNTLLLLVLKPVIVLFFYSMVKFINSVFVAGIKDNEYKVSDRASFVFAARVEMIWLDFSTGIKYAHINP